MWLSIGKRVCGFSKLSGSKEVLLSYLLFNFLTEFSAFVLLVEFLSVVVTVLPPIGVWPKSLPWLSVAPDLMSNLFLSMLTGFWYLSWLNSMFYSSFSLMLNIRWEGFGKMYFDFDLVLGSELSLFMLPMVDL